MSHGTPDLTKYDLARHSTCEDKFLFIESLPAPSAKIRAVTLGSNFTARISCQVSFCRRKISGLELVFSVIDLDFKAVDQLISVKLYISNLHHNP